jgi:uncharacterized membrane protein
LEESFKEFAGYIALAVEVGAAIVIALGALEAFFLILRRPFGGRMGLGDKKEVWLHFAAWLVIGLEFELAADVLRTAISPTWDDIGQLASIAVIRTVLNYFLGKDIEKFQERSPEAEAA